jgi:hypothetical protein
MQNRNMPNRDPRSFSDMKRDQMGREGDVLSQLMGDAQELRALSGREVEMDSKRNEILFKITTEMEDTRAALKDAEALVERLRKHMAQLDGMYKILTKK